MSRHQNSWSTWRQGEYLDFPKYKHMDEGWKQECRTREKLLVRSAPEGNAVCVANDPDSAIWIAKRLNRAAKLERLLHEYLSGYSSLNELRSGFQDGLDPEPKEVASFRPK